MICSDDCDQVHCGNCGCHTIGNSLIQGLCQDCFQAQEDALNDYMNECYRLEQRRWFPQTVV